MIALSLVFYKWSAPGVPGGTGKAAITSTFRHDRTIMSVLVVIGARSDRRDRKGCERLYFDN